MEFDHRRNTTSSGSNEESSAVKQYYYGVRKRKWGKYVSEIREPGKKTRIWLGSFESAEMAAVAHDVAVLRLKGSSSAVSAQLNFPELADQLPRPASSSARDIRSAALEAAATLTLRRTRCDSLAEIDNVNIHDQFGYREEMGLDSPRMWTELAEALLISPPACGGEVAAVAEAEEFCWGGMSLWDYSLV